MKKEIKPGIVVYENSFTPEKTNDSFKEVEFTYGTLTWEGVLPLILDKQGLKLSETEFLESLEKNYNQIDPQNKVEWIEKSDEQWTDKQSATYKVLSALYSGNWECRVCGPVPKINPQPAARLKSLKVKGYVIGSKRRYCKSCSKKTMHDILVMMPTIETKFSHGNELRKPISQTLVKKIKRLLNYKEVCFDVSRTEKELLIDHKFPSQRWNQPESDNPNDMTDDEIKKKFQLLSNQTNMLKSRYCENCVKNGKRGTFMGIKWYYQGIENWEGDINSEDGCVGCPWYDLALWKTKLEEALQKEFEVTDK